jgi:hypothetical protein
MPEILHYTFNAQIKRYNILFEKKEVVWRLAQGFELWEKI